MGKKRGLGVPEASGYPAKPVLIPVRVSTAAPGGHGYSLAAGTWWPSPALPVLESLREANTVPPASDGGDQGGAHSIPPLARQDSWTLASRRALRSAKQITDTLHV